MASEAFDFVDWVIKYETGQLGSGEAVTEGFQHIINNGVVWRLQGSYGRTAYNLIESGQYTMPETEEERIC
jgi:hypothetical protein